MAEGGLPRDPAFLNAMKTSDRQAWEDGWDTCDETNSDAFRMEAFRRMLQSGQAAAEWSED